MASSSEIFDLTLESDFIDVSLASDAMDFTMDSESWKEVVIEDIAAVKDDTTQGVNEPPLTSTPKKTLAVLSLGKCVCVQCLPAVLLKLYTRSIAD